MQIGLVIQNLVKYAKKKLFKKIQGKSELFRSKDFSNFREHFLVNVALIFHKNPKMFDFRLKTPIPSLNQGQASE